MATSSSSAKPKAGDMVEFPRKQGYAHFGISDGKGHVIHTTSASDGAASGSVVKKELLEKVAAGGTYKVNNQDHNQKAFPPQTIVAEAEKWVGKRWPYRPLANNCETFASKMRYGTDNGFSEQGRQITEKYDEQTKDFLSKPESHNPFDGGHF